MIKDILQITTTNDFKGVNARNLHQALKVGRDFSTWIKGRLDKAGFIAEQDFIIVQNTAIGSPKRGNQKEGNRREVNEYLLSIDAAKHICLMENNEVGKEIRTTSFKPKSNYRKSPRMCIATTYRQRRND